MVTSPRLSSGTVMEHRKSYQKRRQSRSWIHKTQRILLRERIHWNAKWETIIKCIHHFLMSAKKPLLSKKALPQPTYHEATITPIKYTSPTPKVLSIVEETLEPTSYPEIHDCPKKPRPKVNTGFPFKYLWALAGIIPLCPYHRLHFPAGAILQSRR